MLQEGTFTFFSDLSTAELTVQRRSCARGPCVHIELMCMSLPLLPSLSHYLTPPATLRPFLLRTRLSTLSTSSYKEAGFTWSRKEKS